MADAGDISESQEILASAAVYLMDSEDQDLANTLLSSKLLVHNFPNSIPSYYVIELVGPKSLVDSMAGLSDVAKEAYYTDIKSETSIGRIRRVVAQACPYEMKAVGVKLTIVARTGIADLAYREATRKLVEAAGVKLPTVSGVRVKDKGGEVALHPISIFPTGVFERKSNLCFVIMPFAPDFQPVYDHGIKPALQSVNLECRRGDDILQPGDILKQIWISLIQARMVIADLTGPNGNVLYELGIAHVIGHEAILLTQDINAIPFDLRHQRHIIYAATPEGLNTLSSRLAQAINETIGAEP